ncbi:hypothetical protein BB558_007245 [Smittium angustum]|uniref:RING-type domain-containing protein n=1 Tax=Smittium angustum TaxID=133377 RepID=A0A2U1IVJ8_SMIAN|nr:hypothetical protein BB558_007245 [Smittium angustum]
MLNSFTQNPKETAIEITPENKIQLSDKSETFNLIYNSIWIPQNSSNKSTSLYISKDSSQIFSKISDEFLKEILDFSILMVSGIQSSDFYSKISFLSSKINDISHLLSHVINDFLDNLKCSPHHIYSELPFEFILKNEKPYPDFFHQKISKQSTSDYNECSSEYTNNEHKYPSTAVVKYISGCINRYTCMSCLYSFKFTDAIVDISLKNNQHTCEFCHRTGFFFQGVFSLNFSFADLEKDLENSTWFISDFFYGLLSNKSNEESVKNLTQIPYFERNSSSLIKTKQISPTLDENSSEMVSEPIFFNSELFLVLGNPTMNSSSNPIFQELCSQSKQILKISPCIGIDSPSQVDIDTNMTPDETTYDSRTFHESKKFPGYSESLSTKSYKNKKKEKASFNHLLNFSLPPRIVDNSHYPRKPPSKFDYHPYSREAFVGSNYRFILKYGKANKSILTNPNYKFDWDDIEQIVVPSNDAMFCPICLDPPVVPRITRCGHVYCYNCILRFFAETESNRKCPVCWSVIEESDLRRTMLWENIGILKESINSNSFVQSVDMRLMCRIPGTCFSYPKSSLFWNQFDFSSDDTENMLPFSGSDSDAIGFAKFMWGLSSNTDECREQEISELMKKINSETDQISKIYLDIALSILRAEPNSLANATQSKRISENRSEIDSIAENKLLNRNQTTKKINFTDPNFRQNKKHQQFDSKSSFHSNQLHNTLEPSLFQKSAPKTKNSSAINPKEPRLEHEPCLFYQSADGQQLYLSPLDVHILKEQYKNFGTLPDQISIPIVHVSVASMTNEFRKKSKIYEHIPLRCEIMIAEADLSKLVEPSLLKSYEKRLCKREKQHPRLDRNGHENKQSDGSSVNRKALDSLSKSDQHQIAEDFSKTYSDLLETINHDSRGSGDRSNNFGLDRNSNASMLIPIFGSTALESEFPELVSESSLKNTSLSSDFHPSQGLDKSGFTNTTNSLHTKKELQTLNNESNNPFSTSVFSSSENRDYHQNMNTVWGSDSRSVILGTQSGKFNQQAVWGNKQTRNDSMSANMVDMGDVWTQLDNHKKKQPNQNSNETKGSKSKKRQSQKSVIKVSVTGSLGFHKR